MSEKIPQCITEEQAREVCFACEVAVTWNSCNSGKYEMHAWINSHDIDTASDTFLGCVNKFLSEFWERGFFCTNDELKKRVIAILEAKP